MGIDKQRRGVSRPSFRQGKVTTVTAPSTAVNPGVIALNATSTTGPVLVTLARLPKRGETLAVHSLKAGASSAGAGYHVMAAAGSFFGSSSQDMATILGHGDGFQAIAMSSARWGVIGNNNATFSTST